MVKFHHMRREDLQALPGIISNEDNGGNGKSEQKHIRYIFFAFIRLMSPIMAHIVSLFSKSMKVRIRH